MITMAQICQVWGGDCHIPIIASNKYSEQYKKTLKLILYSCFAHMLLLEEKSRECGTSGKMSYLA